MRDSLLILACFICGIILARLDAIPAWLLRNDPTLPALWLLMALVGLSLGADPKLAEILRSLKPTVLLMPLATTGGTFAGAMVAAILVPWSLTDCLAVGSGFGYYSLSSIFITQYRGPDLGTIALLANILREIFTLLLAPAVFKLVGPAAAISCGGATTMDTTLPILSRVAGSAWVLPAVIHAIILDFSVPFWVTLFCSFQ